MSKNLTVDGINYTGVQKIEALDSDTNQYVSFVDTSDADAIDSDILSGKTAYVDGVKITGTGSGGQVVDENSGCVFIDYDGTELYKYSVDEALALTALPNNPTHTGLISQGWNWTLQEIKEYLTDCNKCRIVVGQQYTTENNSTRIFIDIDECSLDVRLQITFVTTGTTPSWEVDWGDSTVVTGSGSFNITHSYQLAGSYTISVTQTTSTSYAYQYIPNGTSSGSTLFSSATLGSGAPSQRFYNCVKEIHLGSNTVFGNYAFYSMRQLRAAVLPSNIVNISDSAFRNCFALKSITLPAAVSTVGTFSFANNYSLVEASLPTSLTSIGNSSFSGCSVRYITIPKQTSLGSTILNSSMVEKVILPTASYTSAFNGCYTLKEIYSYSGKGAVGSSTFNNCYALHKVGFSITSAGSNGFSNCFSLNEITVDDSVSAPRTIGSSAFSASRCLRKVNNIEYAKTISDNAFANSTVCGDVLLTSATTVGSQAFLNSRIESVITGANLTSITGTGAFQQINTLKSANLSASTSLTSLPENCFRYCYTLTDVKLPEGLLYLYTRAFGSNESLVSINLPSSLTTINAYVFENCHSLSHLVIPQSVTAFSFGATNGCSAIQYIEMRPTSPPTSNLNVSNIPSSCIIYVPTVSLANYLAATNYPSPSTYTYIGWAVYESAQSLPTQDSTQTYNLTWYASREDAINTINPITVGNGNEIYCRYTAV